MKKVRSPLDQLPAVVRPLLRKGAQPAWIPPMLAKLTDRPFSRAGWVFEPKWDGVRCLILRDRRGRVRLISRNQKPLNKRFPGLSTAIENQSSRPFIADGEVVAFDGKTT